MVFQKFAPLLKIPGVKFDLFFPEPEPFASTLFLAIFNLKKVRRGCRVLYKEDASTFKGLQKRSAKGERALISGTRKKIRTLRARQKHEPL